MQSIFNPPVTSDAFVKYFGASGWWQAGNKICDYIIFIITPPPIL